MCILRTLPGVFQFTFHNVSINTWSNITSNNRLSVFTFHNVSINTMRSAKCRYAHSTFTFHNVSINTRDDRARYHRKKNLHSTMFLLIPAGASALSDSAFKFTFHNVSINTVKRFGKKQKPVKNLHSTMFLLIQWLRYVRQCQKKNLHSTMFLLIQDTNSRKHR